MVSRQESRSRMKPSSAGPTAHYGHVQRHLGWDSGSRQIMNWSFDKQGNPQKFVWIKTGNKTWRVGRSAEMRQVQ